MLVLCEKNKVRGEKARQSETQLTSSGYTESGQTKRGTARLYPAGAEVGKQQAG